MCTYIDGNSAFQALTYIETVQYVPILSAKNPTNICIDFSPQDTLLKDRQSSLVSSHPIKILFMCCVYFTLIMKLLVLGRKNHNSSRISKIQDSLLIIHLQLWTVAWIKTNHLMSSLKCFNLYDLIFHRLSLNDSLSN